MELQVNNKFEECYKVLIKCLDSYTEWTDKHAAWLDFDTCKLSSGATWTIYKYEPLPTMSDWYLFGADSYNSKVCFPGFTPISNLWKYTNNPIWAIYSIWMDIAQIYVQGTSIFGWP